MSTKIATNVDSLRGLRNLVKTTELQSRTLQRLATGSQINSAQDDPAGLIASETLRSQITAINLSIKNSNRANNVIGTADAALGEITNLLNQVRGLVQEGLNKGAISLTEVQANQQQVDAALSAINRIATNTAFAGDKLLDGSKAFTTVVSSTDASKLTEYQINEALFGAAGSIVVDTTVVTAASRGALTYNAGNLTSAATLEISGSRGSQVLFFGAGTTYTNIVNAVNANTDVTGVSASITTAATPATLLRTSAGGNNDIRFTDARQDAGASDAAINIVFVQSGNNTARSIVVSGTTITVNLATDGAGAVAGTETANSIAAAINGHAQASTLVSAAAGAGVEGDGSGVVAAAASASLSGGVNATLTLSSSEFGSKHFVDVNVLNGSFATFVGSTATRRSTGTDIVARVNGQTAIGEGLKASVQTQLLSASVTFASASNVANTNAKVTITGGGSLFQIGQDVSTAGQVGIGIESINTARLGGVAGKLYELGTGGGKSLIDARNGTVQGSTLVDIISAARDRVNTLRARLGVQKNVIETNVNSLSVALENLSEARSNIADADFAAETANLTKAQILSQAGIATLQIANSGPQQVLALLQ